MRRQELAEPNSDMTSVFISDECVFTDCVNMLVDEARVLEIMKKRENPLILESFTN